MANFFKSRLEGLFGSHTKVRTVIVAGGFLFLLEAAALFLSGYVEGTFWLAGDGVGALQSALWIIIIGDWLLLILIFFLVRHIYRIHGEFPLKPGDESTRYLQDTQGEMLDRIFLRTSLRDAAPLFMFIGGGMFFFLYNFIRMNNPSAHFAFTMFNTSDYPIGFWSGRFILFTSWVVLIPYLAYVCLTTLVFVRRMILVGQSDPSKALWFEFGHPDKHGGFTYLSGLNVLFSLGIFVLFVELIAEVITLPVITLPVKIMLPVVTIIFIWLTFWFMSPVEKFMRETKKQADKSLKKTSLDVEKPDHDSTHFMVKYNHIKNNLNFTLNTMWSNAVLSSVRVFSLLGTAYKFLGVPSL